MCFFNHNNGNLFVFTNFLNNFALWTSPSFYIDLKNRRGSLPESCDSCPEKVSCWCNALSACWALLLQLAWSAYKRSFIVSACVVCFCLASLEAVQGGRRERRLQQLPPHTSDEIQQTACFSLPNLTIHLLFIIYCQNSRHCSITKFFFRTQIPDVWESKNI